MLARWLEKNYTRRICKLGLAVLPYSCLLALNNSFLIHDAWRYNSKTTYTFTTVK
jgi:hypothetical protein